MSHIGNYQMPEGWVEEEEQPGIHEVDKGRNYTPMSGRVH